MVEKNGRWWKSLGGEQWIDGVPGTFPLRNERRITAIPEPIARLIFEEYPYDDVSFEEIHAQGGFGVAEAFASLADIIERERHP